LEKSGARWHDRVASISSEAEHVAYRQNYLDLDHTYTDQYGDSLMRLTLDWTAHERAQGAMLTKIHAEIAKAMNGRAALPSRLLERSTVTQYLSTHVNGGAIMGTSPGRSVVNPWLQHWRLSNLWVMGGSAFPAKRLGKPYADDSRSHPPGS
jgi:gluconate 2-dehydrogenase alpha chain